MSAQYIVHLWDAKPKRSYNLENWNWRNLNPLDDSNKLPFMLTENLKHNQWQPGKPSNLYLNMFKSVLDYVGLPFYNASNSLLIYLSLYIPN